MFLFLNPHFSDMIFVKYPKKEASWNTYINPFSLKLWLSIGGMIVLIQAAAFTTIYITINKKSKDDNKMMFLETLMIIWGSMTQQGTVIQI